MQLRIPGPTPVPDAVLKAVARPMTDHRNKDFKELIIRVTDKVKKIVQTENDLLMLTSSGTGGMEAAVVNFLSPGDKVLAVIIGNFGARFADIARSSAHAVTPLECE